MTFGLSSACYDVVLSSSYCDVLFIVGLLRYGAFRRFVTVLYLCGVIQTSKTVEYIRLWSSEN